MTELRRKYNREYAVKRRAASEKVRSPARMGETLLNPGIRRLRVVAYWWRTWGLPRAALDKRKALAATHQWRKDHPETPEARRRRVYRLANQDYQTMIIQQKGACAICDRIRPLKVDHCHATGRVRGLLCNGCNVGLGRVENLEWFGRASQYLKGGHKV